MIGSPTLTRSGGQTDDDNTQPIQVTTQFTAVQLANFDRMIEDKKREMAMSDSIWRDGDKNGKKGKNGRGYDG